MSFAIRRTLLALPRTMAVRSFASSQSASKTVTETVTDTVKDAAAKVLHHNRFEALLHR